MAAPERIVFDGFRYEFEEMSLHAEGQRPKPCVLLRIIDDERGYQAEAWFSPEAFEQFKADMHRGVFVPAAPTKRLGV